MKLEIFPSELLTVITNCETVSEATIKLSDALLAEGGCSSTFMDAYERSMKLILQANKSNAAVVHQVRTRTIPDEVT